VKPGPAVTMAMPGLRVSFPHAIARKLVESGCNIVVADLGETGGDDQQVRTGTTDEMETIVEELAAEFGIRSLAVSVDVADKGSVDKMAAAVGAEFDVLHILCNNAGASFGVPNTVQNYDEEAWMKTIDINLHGVFRVSRAVLPMMVEKGGVIINTASRAGKVPPLFNGAYAVAKAGVIMLTKVMARELAATGLRFNSICPGQVMTDQEKWRFGLEAQFFDTTVEEREAEMCQTIPLNRIGKPEEVGDLVAFLASDASSYLTGQAVNITGGQLMEL